MRSIIWFALVALLASAAFGQTPDQPPGPPALPGTPDTKLPLAAMRHIQPRRAQVEEREHAEFGSSLAPAQQRRRAEEDELYNEIMRRSAPDAAR